MSKAEAKTPPTDDRCLWQAFIMWSPKRLDVRFYKVTRETAKCWYFNDQYGRVRRIRKSDLTKHWMGAMHWSKAEAIEALRSKLKSELSSPDGYRRRLANEELELVTREYPDA